MKTKTVTLYVANDGTEFTDSQACLRYESRSRILESIDPQLSEYDLSPGDVVDAILKKYAIVPKQKLKDLETLATCVSELISHSRGVVGYHNNGDEAPWEDFLKGGRMETWLEVLHDLDNKNYDDPMP